MEVTVLGGTGPYELFSACKYGAQVFVKITVYAAAMVGGRWVAAACWVILWHT